MAILGVLLGITMTVLGYVLYQFDKLWNCSNAQINDLTERVTVLEKRKALLAEAATSAPKPTGVATRLPRWNENAPYVEKA